MELVGVYSNKSRTLQQLRDLLLLTPEGRPQQEQKTRRRQAWLRKDQLEPLKRDYQAGSLIKDLAQTYGVSTDAVMDHVKRAQLPKRYPRLSIQDTERAVQMYADGDSLAKIAASLGVAPGTISLALKQAGISIRPRRGWR